MAAPYLDISTVNATGDISNILVYANHLTGDILMPVILVAFFLISCIGLYFAQIRMGRDRIDIAYTVASFLTFGFAVIMSSKDGLLNPVVLIITFVMSVLGVLWLWMAGNE